MIARGLVSAVVLLGLWPRSSEAEDKKFTPLFDGKSVAGWEGDLSVFRIEDGAIVAGNLKSPIPRNEFLCTKQEYGDFELRLKAKLVGQGKNAGIQFRSRRIPNHHEVIGYQCDVGEAFGRTVWGALYDESRRRKMLAEGQPEVVAKAFKPNDWNEFIIRCEGPRIQIWLNGQQTVDYTEPDPAIERTGLIGLQIHGGPPAEAWYKDVRIQSLAGAKGQRGKVKYKSASIGWRGRTAQRRATRRGVHVIFGVAQLRCAPTAEVFVWPVSLDP